MARCRFVQPMTKVIHLSDGDWLEVKKQLSVGEARSAFQAIVGEVNPQGWRKPNVEMIGIAEMMAYIVDWSFTGPDGKRVKFELSALKQIDSETFDEIEKAIEKHIGEMAHEETERKNSRGGEIKLVQTSPSAESSGGAIGN